MNRPVPVLLAGVHGHGRHHLRALKRLADSATIRPVGVCDPRPIDPGDDLEGNGPLPSFTDLGRAIDTTGAQITILATPIHTHLPLSRTALEHGSHLLLEKPTTATLAEFDELTTAVDASGLACQVGFQSLGSAAVDSVRALIQAGTIGGLRGIGGVGTWSRTSHYYDRAPWAGRRSLNGRDVVDGALTNPFAHAVATALTLAGADTDAPPGIEVELFHAHPIESDDTSCVRVRTADGTPITVAVTLCAPGNPPPRLIVHGDRGRIELDYTLDRVTLSRPGHDPVTTTHPRTDLLQNLVDHVRQGAFLLVPPERTRGFTHVMEAIRTADAPSPIPAERQRVTTTPEGTHRLVDGIEDLVHRSAESLALFSELDPTWASAAMTATDSAKARP